MPLPFVCLLCLCHLSGYCVLAPCLSYVAFPLSLPVSLAPVYPMCICPHVSPYFSLPSVYLLYVYPLSARPWDFYVFFVPIATFLFRWLIFSLAFSFHLSFPHHISSIVPYEWVFFTDLIYSMVLSLTDGQCQIPKATGCFIIKSLVSIVSTVIFCNVH